MTRDVSEDTDGFATMVFVTWGGRKLQPWANIHIRRRGV